MWLIDEDPQEPKINVQVFPPESSSPPTSNLPSFCNRGRGFASSAGTTSSLEESYTSGGLKLKGLWGMASSGEDQMLISMSVNLRRELAAKVPL